jgi:hypothetical protein
MVKLLPSSQSWVSVAGSVGRISAAAAAAAAVAEVVGIAVNNLVGRTPAAGHTVDTLLHSLVDRIVGTVHNLLAVHTVDIHYIAGHSHHTADTGFQGRTAGHPAEMIVRLV